MKRLQKPLLAVLLFISVNYLQAGSKNYLSECWNRQVKPLNEKYLALFYNETANKLYHDLEPWKQTKLASKGCVWISPAGFLKHDTLMRKKLYFSKTQYNRTELLYVDYFSDKLAGVTQSDLDDELFESARYNPVMLIDHFFRKKILLSSESDKDFAVYTSTINKSIVKLYIHKNDMLVHKITTLSSHDLYGDVLNTYLYTGYVNTGNLQYAQNIGIEKINGKIKDEVKILLGNLVTEAPKLIERPADYKLKDEKDEAPAIHVEKYSDNIYFIELKHTDDRVLLVTFKDFILVESAPLNSNNGELIIAEAHKIAPGKPIKYFTFGHHHAHYLGGMRAFVHKGVTILSVSSDNDYLNYLSAAPHTLNPDSLQLQPKPLKIEEVKESKTISDGTYSMTIYFIGAKSGHTNDYLVYYFPKEKTVFEDDLLGISKTGEIEKASERQAGFYNAIKPLNLDIKTIVQGWPVSAYNLKTVIPFEDLERSMNIK